MRKRSMWAALLATVVALPSLALAAVVVHNTGVDTSNVLVAPGAQASFWTLSAAPSGATESIGDLPFRYINGAYFADTGSAAWVSPQSSGNAGQLGPYTYDLVIDLAGVDPAWVSLSGTFGTDNEGAIWLNANAPVATTGFADFGVPTPFTIDSGFVPGLNTIHVQVSNDGDPTAFFVAFTSVAASPVAVPVPATSWPTLAALAWLLAVMGSLPYRKIRTTR